MRMNTKKKKMRKIESWGSRIEGCNPGPVIFGSLRAA